MKSVFLTSLSVLFPTLVFAQSAPKKLIEFRTQSTLSNQETGSLMSEYGQFLRNDQESIVSQTTAAKIESQIQTGMIRRLTYRTDNFEKHLETLSLNELNTINSDIFSDQLKTNADFDSKCSASISKPRAAGQEFGFEMSKFQIIDKKELRGSSEGLTDLLVSAFLTAHQNRIEVAGRNIRIFNVIDYDPATGHKIENPILPNNFSLPYNQTRKVRTCLDVPFVEARCLTLKYRKVKLSESASAVLVSVGRTDGPTDPTSMWSNVKLNRVTEGTGLVVIKEDRENIFYKAVFSGSLESRQLPQDMIKYDPSFAQFMQNPSQPIYDLGCFYLDTFKVFPSLPGLNPSSMLTNKLATVINRKRMEQRNKCNQMLTKIVDLKADLIRPQLDEMRKELPKVIAIKIADLENTFRSWSERGRNPFDTAENHAQFLKAMAERIKLAKTDPEKVFQLNDVIAACKRGDNFSCVSYAALVAKVTDTFKASLRTNEDHNISCGSRTESEELLKAL